MARRAIVLDIGGFRPSGDPRTSWFGRVNLAQAGESWPMSAGKPMLALCQINLAELPFLPPRLADLSFVSVFVDPVELPDNDANGNRWCLRAYRSSATLVPLAQPNTQSPIRALPMRPRVVEEDFPSLDDVPVELDPDVDDKYYDLFKNEGGLKLGGWPTLIQSEIFWGPRKQHPAAPEYVFQIDSTEPGHWSWGDGGVGYFGRGTAAGHEDEWACEWQCM